MTNHTGLIKNKRYILPIANNNNLIMNNNNIKINYFTEKETTLYADVKMLCLQYLEYFLDERHIKKYKYMRYTDEEWKYICKTKTMSENFMEAFICRKNIFGEMVLYQKLSLSFIKRYIDKIDFYCLSQGYLNIEIINECFDKLDFNKISKYACFGEDVIVKYFDNINWDLFSRNAYIDNKLKNKYKFMWKMDEKYKHLQEKYLYEKDIEKYKKIEFTNQDWAYICDSKIMSEKFMEAFMDNHNFWGIIIMCQKLSIKFIEKHIDKIDMHCLSQSILNVEIIKKYKNKLNFDMISINAIFDEHVINTFINDINWEFFEDNIYIDKKLKNKYKFMWE